MIGNDSPSQSVTWTVEGNSSASTVITTAVVLNENFITPQDVEKIILEFVFYDIVLEE